MRARRKFAGRKIKRARLAAGYSSQREFAAACGVDESSIGHTESGSPRVAIGAKVFTMIELRLGWPDGCIERYLTTGDESQLPTATAEQPPPLRYPNDPERQAIWEQFDGFNLSDDDRAERVERIMQVRRGRGGSAATGS